MCTLAGRLRHELNEAAIRPLRVLGPGESTTTWEIQGAGENSPVRAEPGASKPAWNGVLGGVGLAPLAFRLAQFEGNSPPALRLLMQNEAGGALANRRLDGAVVAVGIACYLCE